VNAHSHELTFNDRIEVGAEALPRLIEATYAHGVVRQAIEVSDPHEFGVDQRTYVLTSSAARIVLESADYIVEVYGSLKVVFVLTAPQREGPPRSALKILLWEFEKKAQKGFGPPAFARGAPQLTTNELGYTSVMRCFEIADIFMCMSELMRYSIENNCPPIGTCPKETVV